MPALRPPVTVLGALLIAGGLWIGLAGLRRNNRGILVRTGATHVAVYLVLLAWLLPAANQLKTTKPQAEWIRQQMGDSTHMGLVYNHHDYGFRKMGTFGLYAQTGVELLESNSQVERFFEVHPDSVVLIQVDEVDWIFRDDHAAWQPRIVRDLWIGMDHYIVVRGPESAALNSQILSFEF